MLALVAKLRVLGIPEPRLWINKKHPDYDVNGYITHIAVTELTENEARRNWLVIQHEITAALKRHKGVWK